MKTQTSKFAPASRVFAATGRRARPASLIFKTAGVVSFAHMAWHVLGLAGAVHGLSLA